MKNGYFLLLLAHSFTHNLIIFTHKSPYKKRIIAIFLLYNPVGTNIITETENTASHFVPIVVLLLTAIKQ